MQSKPDRCDKSSHIDPLRQADPLSRRFSPLRHASACRFVSLRQAERRPAKAARLSFSMPVRPLRRTSSISISATYHDPDRRAHPARRTYPIRCCATAYANPILRDRPSLSSATSPTLPRLCDKPALIWPDRSNRTNHGGPLDRPVHSSATNHAASTCAVATNLFAALRPDATNPAWPRPAQSERRTIPILSFATNLIGTILCDRPNQSVPYLPSMTLRRKSTPCQSPYHPLWMSFL
jgi:hypothetical protein